MSSRIDPKVREELIQKALETDEGKLRLLRALLAPLETLKRIAWLRDPQQQPAADLELLEALDHLIVDTQETISWAERGEFVSNGAALAMVHRHEAIMEAKDNLSVFDVWLGREVIPCWKLTSDEAPISEPPVEAPTEDTGGGSEVRGST